MLPNLGSYKEAGSRVPINSLCCKNYKYTETVDKLNRGALDRATSLVTGF